MANIVLLTAGGIGSRTHQSIPKQFISIKDKPIILYTMEKFQKHPEIDKIVIACLEGWESCLESYAHQYGITKLAKVILGGRTGFESIKNGLKAIKEFAKEDDIVLIHDGNRPGVGNDTISDCIFTAKTQGNAVTTISENGVVFQRNDDGTNTLLDRDKIMRTQTPHAAPFGKMTGLYARAEKEGITDLVAFCSLLHIFGEEINFVEGSEKNFKITYKDDIDLFKGLVYIEEEKNDKV